jgi:hypothetical protein
MTAFGFSLSEVGIIIAKENIQSNLPHRDRQQIWPKPELCDQSPASTGAPWLTIGHFEISERLMKLIMDIKIRKIRITNNSPRKTGIMKISEKTTVNRNK